MARTTTTSKTMSSKTDNAEQIRKKAYELYEKRGKKSGNAMSDWLEAERIVRQKSY
jgi:hypothetical protein